MHGCLDKIWSTWKIEKLYYHIQKYPLTEEEKGDYEDDLPNFLLELEEYELHRMINNIKHNLVI